MIAILGTLGRSVDSQSNFVHFITKLLGWRTDDIKITVKIRETQYTQRFGIEWSDRKTKDTNSLSFEDETSKNWEYCNNPKFLRAK